MIGQHDAAPREVCAVDRRRRDKQPYVDIADVMGCDLKVVRMATQSNKTEAMRSRPSLRSQLVRSAQDTVIRLVMGYGLRASSILPPRGPMPWETDISPWSLSKRDRGLIGFMIRERHGVPFEHNVVTFKVITNVRVAREHQRHRIGVFTDLEPVGSFSELSSRWVEMSRSDAYIPERKAIRTQVGKRAEYKMVPVTSKLKQDLSLAGHWVGNAVSFWLYHGLCKIEAKELAAYVLPLGTQTEYYWTVNLRSLWNFISLRNAPTALYEIRQIAEQVERLASERYPVCFEMWNKYNRPVV